MFLFVAEQDLLNMNLIKQIKDQKTRVEIAKFLVPQSRWLKYRLQLIKELDISNPKDRLEIAKIAFLRNASNGNYIDEYETRRPR